MKNVYTSGTFDLFHIGHLRVLQRSAELGDRLVVGVSTDELVASYKQKPPIISLSERLEIIQSLRCVDQVVVQSSLFSQTLMTEQNISIMTIGSDWEGKDVPGLKWVHEHPTIELVYLPYTTHVSSTKIKQQILDGWQEDKATV